MKTSNLLPSAFADLEPFAATWALPTFDARMQLRAASSMADIRAFYEAMQPRADAALAYLEAFPLNEMPMAEQNLARLLYALAQAAMAVEMHGQPKVAHAPLPIPVRVLRESAPV